MAENGDIHEEIDRLIGFGYHEPEEYGPLLEQRLGGDWLREQVAAYAYEFVTFLGKARLNELRRANERAIATDNPRAELDLRLKIVWIPGRGRKRYGEVTADDLDARADWLERASQLIFERAQWCRDLSARMRAEGAETLADLRSPIPPLPEAGRREIAA